MNIFTILAKHKITAIFSILAVSAVSLAIINTLKTQTATQTTESSPTVSLVLASSYQKQKTVDISNGTVQSLGQADLRSQFSAPISEVNAKLGDTVAAGKVLVQLKNDDVSAQLEQAQAVLASAQSRLDELKRGNRAEDIAISQTSANETQTALINSIKDAYAKSDDAIHNHIDKFFQNPREKNANFLIVFNIGGSQATMQPSDSDLARDVSNKKYVLESTLKIWQDTTSKLQASSNKSDIETALAAAKSNLQSEIDFMNLMAPIVNDLTIDSTTYKQVIDGYKTEFSASRSAVSGALASLQGAETSWRTANKSLDLKLAGSSEEQINQGQAAVGQAQASVNALRATLAKTAIVSPIAGEVSHIDGHIGEFISAGTLVASVINPGMLQVKAYISENDLPFVSENDAVTIGNSAAGVVQTISPAVDFQTKKAEVNILVTENVRNQIVVGQNVSLKIASAKLKQTGDVYLLPIEMVQFSGNGNCVFIVSNGVIGQIPVTTGEIVGENVYVTKGLTSDMEIVSSVRGLKAGDQVKIQ
jgi:RND family efflux transporter MFP subunit